MVKKEICDRAKQVYGWRLRAATVHSSNLAWTSSISSIAKESLTSTRFLWAFAAEDGDSFWAKKVAGMCFSGPPSMQVIP